MLDCVGRCGWSDFVKWQRKLIVALSVHTDGNKFPPYIPYSQCGNQFVECKSRIIRDFIVRDNSENPVNGLKRAAANEDFKIAVIEK